MYGMKVLVYSTRMRNQAQFDSISFSRRLDGIHQSEYDPASRDSLQDIEEQVDDVQVERDDC